MANPVGASGRAAAYERLRDVVLTDPSVQGAFLTEATLVEQIGLSRTPIREALIMLAADGLVELIPHRGAYVPPATPKTVRDMFDMRRVIEEHAARVTIAADAVPVAAMRELLEEQRALGAGDARAKEFISIDQAFHAVLVNAADNSFMSEAYRRLRVQHVRLGITAAADSGRFAAVLQEHEAILSGLAAGDVEAALQAIDAHIDITRDILLARVDLTAAARG